MSRKVSTLLAGSSKDQCRETARQSLSDMFQVATSVMDVAEADDFWNFYQQLLKIDINHQYNGSVGNCFNDLVRALIIRFRARYEEEFTERYEDKQ